MADLASNAVPEMAPKRPGNQMSSDAHGGRDIQDFFLQVPTVGLPKGGGALKGIDEKFTVNPVNGTASVAIPLPLHAGPRRRHALDLATYNSGGGNGLFGLGWSLGCGDSSPHRQGPPALRGCADSDTFLLSGADDLVPASAGTMRGDGGRRSSSTSAGCTSSGIAPASKARSRGSSGFARAATARRGGASRTRDKGDLLRPRRPPRVVDPDRPGRGARLQVAAGDLLRRQGQLRRLRLLAEDAAGVTPAMPERNRRNGLAPSANRHLKRIAYGNSTPCFRDPTAPYTPAVPADRGTCSRSVLRLRRSRPGRAPPPPQPWPHGARRSVLELSRGVRDPHAPALPARADVPPLRRAGRRTLRRAWSAPSISHYRFGNTPRHKPSAVNVEPELLADAEVVSYAPLPGGGYSTRSLPAIEFEYQQPAFGTRPCKRCRPEISWPRSGWCLEPEHQWVDLYGEGIAGVFGGARGRVALLREPRRRRRARQARLDSSRLVRPKPSFAGVGSGVLSFEDLDADGRNRWSCARRRSQGYFELEDVDRAPVRSVRAHVRIDLADRRRPDARPGRRRPRGHPRLGRRRIRLVSLGGARGFATRCARPSPPTRSAGRRVVFADGARRSFSPT